MILTENQLIPYKTSEIPKGPYLVFAPHPDDETLGMGGTIALAAKNGIEVSVVFATRGDMGGDPDIRTKEADAAAGCLGIKKIFHLNLGDRKVFEEIFPENTLLDILNNVKPVCLFLPSFQEIHPDHRALTCKVLSLLDKKSDYLGKNHCALGLWFYEINRQGEVNRIIDISSVFEIKMEAVDCYISQFELLDYKSHCRCLDYARSVTIGEHTFYAEGFWCHDSNSGKKPEENYFEQIGRYLHHYTHPHLSGNSYLMAVKHYCFHYEKTEYEHRTLKDRLKNQYVALVSSSNLLGKVSTYLNETVNECKALALKNQKLSREIEALQERIYKINISRAHGLAESYIYMKMALMRFLASMIQGLKNCFIGNGGFDKLSAFDDYNKIKKADDKKLMPDHASLDFGSCELSSDQARNDIPMTILYSIDEIHENDEWSVNKDHKAHGINKVVCLKDEEPYYYSISCGKKKLARIDVFMGTFQRINPGLLILSIYRKSKDKTPLRISEINAPSIVDNSFVSFDFKPIEDSENHFFLLSLCLKNAVHGRCLGVWTSPNQLLSSQEIYQEWIQRVEHSIQEKHSDLFPLIDNFEYTPCIIIVINIFNASKNLLEDTLSSVVGQTYPFRDIIAVCREPSGIDVAHKLSEYAAEGYITQIYDYDKNIENDYEYLNEIIEKSQGKYILFIDSCDTLEQDSLHWLVTWFNRHPDADFIYTDEDRLTEQGRRIEPYFKPGWSPDLLLSCMYIGDLICINKDIFLKAGGFKQSREGFYSYDLVLKCTEITDKVYHIPKILYHRRRPSEVLPMSPGENKFDTILAEKILGKCLERRNINGEVKKGKTPFSFRVSRSIDRTDMVSIIVPFKDHADVLGTCLQSILDRTRYQKYELLCINNQSKRHGTFRLMEQFKLFPHIHFLDYDFPFNFSALNNFAANHAKGKYLLFLNSDTEVISPDWLEAMLEQCCRPEIGAVGAKLYYADDTIQHAGIVMGVAGLAGHAFKHVDRFDVNYYYGFPSMVREVSAVTGACMMVRHALFKEVGGFDEDKFKISYNDLDLCLELRKRGYAIIFTPFAELYHYESYSRGYSYDASATEHIIDKWKGIIENDSYYNINLTNSKEDWTLTL